MSYGLRAYNSVGNVIFDTTKISQTQVVASGTWANNVTLTRNLGEMICFNPPNTTARIYKMTSTSSGITNESGVTINYVKIAQINEQTSFPATGGYGLQTFDSSGDLAYSSGYVQGYKLRSILPEGTLSGNHSSTYPSIAWAESITNIYFSLGGCSYSGGDYYDIFLYESGQMRWMYKIVFGSPIGTTGFNNARVIQVIEVRN